MLTFASFSSIRFKFKIQYMHTFTDLYIMPSVSHKLSLFSSSSLFVRAREASPAFQRGDFPSKISPRHSRQVATCQCDNLRLCTCLPAPFRITSYLVYTENGFLKLDETKTVALSHLNRFKCFQIKLNMHAIKGHKHFHCKREKKHIKYGLST